MGRQEEGQKTVHGFIFDALTSEKTIDLGDYEGKVVLIVNTASKCGFTKQYQGLENLYQGYKDQGFVVLGVPCNDFGGQEPGTHGEISEFCQIHYGVTFPMTAKYSVKGDRAHPFYKWARVQLGFGTAPKWNFHKYLVDRKGELVDYFLSPTAPNSKRLVKAVTGALGAMVKG